MAAIDPKLIKEVRQRAHERCEYCQSPQRIHRLSFQIEHIIARQHGGNDATENLALACGRCNRYKGTNIAGLDPQTKILTRLYHPRNDHWHDHFSWEVPFIRPSNDVGRTTLALLVMNHPDEVAIRRELVAGGFIPPHW